MPDLLVPWQGAALALVVALGWSGLLRLLGQKGLAGFGAGMGLLAGTVLILGVSLGSPRQLPERLPALLGAGLAAGIVIGLLEHGGRTALAAVLAACTLPIGAWWLAGAPLNVADLERGTLTLLAILILLAALLLALGGPWLGVAVAALLFAGLFLARPPGPWLPLVAAALAAGLGSAAAGPVWGHGARLPIALACGLLIAGPVLARGGAADWTAAAGPILALWAAPSLAARLGDSWVARTLAWVIAGGVPLLFTWLLLRPR
jgi:hypothetical protein